MEIRYNNHIEVNKSSYSLKFSPDFNPYHEARVDNYELRIGRTNPQGGGHYQVIQLTFDDLVALRKELRSFIINHNKHESNKRI